MSIAGGAKPPLAQSEQLLPYVRNHGPLQEMKETLKLFITQKAISCDLQDKVILRNIPRTHVNIRFTFS